jgi:5-oxopent-3-ene-1,2,5-tricarboxylate decarboxylase/2-hydroxyhepta-2,4-diene-1,7-dioate isomerase
VKTVVGALLNFRGAWQAMEPAMHLPPHHRPPVHPVLYLKPANTWSTGGRAVVLPADVAEIEIGAALGVVIGRAAARVRRADALAHVAGYRIVNDVTVPHATVLRPPLRQKCRDGFCPMGPVVDAARVPDPDALAIRAYVNDALRQSGSTRDLIRDLAQLIADVSEFMTLDTGDVLLVGIPEGAPRARAGDRMAVEIDGLGRLENPVGHEADAA